MYNMLIIIERVHTDLPEPVVPAMITWGILAISPRIIFPAISFPTAKVSLLFELRNSSEPIISLMVTVSLFSFGTSIPITDFPGTGASIRTPFAARFSAISSSRPLIFDTLTPIPGCISYLVIEGPRNIFLIFTSTLKLLRVFTIMSAFSRISDIASMPFVSSDGGERSSIFGST